jgi:hypothetical protein
MTFTIRTRGAPGLRVVEYLCPEHGRFEAVIADAPDSAFCDCGSLSPLVISAPLTRVKRGEVQRGKSDPRPPHVLNTEALADGMDQGEWAKREDKKAFDERRKVLRSKFT